jgi:hypothetical protein
MGKTIACICEMRSLYKISVGKNLSEENDVTLGDLDGSMRTALNLILKIGLEYVNSTLRVS